MARWLGTVWLGLSLFHTRATDAPSAAQLEFFERRIRPVLVDQCHECHGPEKHKGGLRLDSREGLSKGGDSGPALSRDAPEKSLLIAAIRQEHSEIQMPKGRPKLAPEVIADFVAWVKSGAPDPRNDSTKQGATNRTASWSFQPLIEAPLPLLRNATWAKQPIDAFILAKLESSDLRPAADASPQVWLRRVAFALTGLPPTAEEVRAFGNDTSSTARERVVDRLLASPQFGERWGRHWLDLVRFAESYGHEQDYPIPQAWRYRDYVIRAFNADVPYPQLVREHIAGDLLPNPRLNPTQGFNESILATAWWYLHQATHAPVDPPQDEADRMDNQIDVFSKTFLGITLACARCHDHKFDPFSTRDYYSLMAFLRGTRQDLAYLDPDGTLAERAIAVRAVNQRLTPTVRTAVQTALEQGNPRVESYLLAAEEVLRGVPRPDDSDPNVRPDILFEDFEDGTYRRWTVEGDAFGSQPAMGRHPNQQPVEGFQGNRLANSFTRGDAPKGALRSIPFQIERPFVHFLVGGGGSNQRARFSLIVDGKEVLKTSGHNQEKLESHTWDVREWMGSRATLALIDDDETIWGHLNLDHIVFSDGALPVPSRTARPIAKVAAERGLRASVLERWVEEYRATESKPRSTPLAWALEATVIPDLSNSPPRMGDLNFPESDYRKWFASGEAFRVPEEHRPTWKSQRDQIDFLDSHAIHSNWASDQLQGTLRSPTFQITHTNIHLRLAGNSGQVRLIISRYGLREFNPLLFERTLFDVHSNDQFQWYSITSDLHRHLGRPAYLEFIDTGEGYIAIDRIVFSNHPTPPQTDLLPSPTHSPSPRSNPPPQLLARQLQRSIHEALRNWTRDSTNTEALSLVSWLSRKGLLDWGATESLLTQVRRDSRRASEALPTPLRTLAMTEGTLEPTYVFLRGDPKKRGPEVPRAFPNVLGGDLPPLPAQGSGRLALAEAVLSNRNPLTSRVIVNRIWAHLFGRGLVASVDNFGALGQLPSHPELLDHLATDFQRKGGSIKSLIRSLVLSRTFGMSSTPTDARAEILDPDNTLLHRMPLLRMEGESVRDAILVVAGQLNGTQYGPSVPTHFTPFMGDRMWVRNSNGPMDGDRRRSIYLETRRNFLSPWMLTFDLPLPDSTVGQRNRSNIPGQALALMNDPLVRRMADAWGERVLLDGSNSMDQRLENLFLTAFSRSPTASELNSLHQFLQSQSKLMGLDHVPLRDAAPLWADVCHIVFMMKEFTHVP